MKPFEMYSSLDGLAIYKELQKAWEISGFDRQPTWLEVVLIPIYEGYAPIGAAIYLAVLAYPTAIDQQEAFIDAIGARIIKNAAPPKSATRASVKKDPILSPAIDIPNKRIRQTINDGFRRIHKRFRAAWVLCQKLASNSDPSKQSPLREIILKAAEQNTNRYPAFFSTHLNPEDRDEIIFDSFRRQVMYEARPVIHLALALYINFATGNPKVLMHDMIMSADQWLKEVVIAAEVFRVLFGDLFPQNSTQYKK
ncbi:MAG: hypothetical protein IPK63_11930 [Candidatus Competibacteraceae bacterium]|nr:hypothetical protein [Candidatus Competibacteraceae bacterium]